MSDILHTLEVQLPLPEVDRSYPIILGRALLSDGALWQ